MMRADCRERERQPLAAFLAGCDASSLAARLVFDFQRRQKARATGFASSGWDGRAIGSGKAMGLNEVGLAWKVPRTLLLVSNNHQRPRAELRDSCAAVSGSFDGRTRRRRLYVVHHLRAGGLHVGVSS